LQVRREGKNILVDFSGGNSLKFHLRMTGNLIWEKARTKTAIGGAILHPSTEAHLRCRLNFDRGEMRFIDVRRFGTVELAPSRLVRAELPVDPVEDTLTGEVLQRLIGKSRQAIKVWLLRQDRLVGVGNIYASEILFDCRVDPRREAAALSPAELKALARSTVKILNKAIECCGTTFSDFHNPDGESGKFQSFLKVYQHDQQPCRRCKSPIKRLVQAQRSTFYCAKCQQ